MLESAYQADLIRRLKTLFPGCLILKNDSELQQGIPDLTILWNEHWAFLEVKPFKGAREQPNQDYYIALADEMSFGSFIYPENETEVLRGLQQAFRPRRSARVSQR